MSLCIQIYISQRIFDKIGNVKASKSKFIHTLSEYKNIFALEQRVIVLSFTKNVAFLLGHQVENPQ